MDWIWTKRGFDQTLTGIMKAPHFYAYSSIAFAFIAGFDLRGLIWRMRNHTVEVLDYLTCPSMLLVALLWTYCVALNKLVLRFKPKPCLGRVARAFDLADWIKKWVRCCRE